MQSAKVFYTEGGKEEFEVEDKMQLIPGAIQFVTGPETSTVIPMSSIKKIELHTKEAKVTLAGGKIILPGQGNA